MADNTKGYATDPVTKWLYPPRDMPPSGVKLNLLNEGGIACQGQWSWYGGFIAWAPLHKRDKAYEPTAIAFIKEQK